MSGKKFRKLDQEYIILPPGKPTYYEPNPFTGSKRECKCRVISFIWMFSPHFPLVLQIRRLKCKYKRFCVPAMNLKSVKLYGLCDI